MNWLLKLLKNKTFWTKIVLPAIGSKVVDDTVKRVSNGKYSGVSDWAYDTTGLDDATKGTILEGPTRLVLEGLNPGFYVGNFGNIAYKGIQKTYPYMTRIVDSSTGLRKMRYGVNNYMNGLEDLQNHIKFKTQAGSTYFNEWKQGAEKIVKGNNTIYTNGNYILKESPGRILFTDKNGTFKVGNLTNNSYYVTVTPQYGQTKAPLSSVKTVYDIVNKSTPGTYFVADPTSLPKGLVLRDLYDNKNYLGIIKNLLGFDTTPTFGLAGYSTDAHKYISKMSKNPSITTRYNPVPMTSFNTFGNNSKLYSDVLVADVAENPYVKQTLLSKINKELLAMGSDPAYLQNGIVHIPQPSLMTKYPVEYTIKPQTLLRGNK